MADWQGKRPGNKKKQSSEKESSGLERSEHRADPPKRKTWNQGQDRQINTSDGRDNTWHSRSESIVDWKKFFQRAKMVTAVLLTLLLIAWFVYLNVRVSDKTHLTLVSPATDTKHWLSTTPYATVLQRQFVNLDSNNQYLTSSIVSLDDCWNKFEESEVVQLGGPDGAFAVIYLCIVGIVADKDHDQVLEAYALPADGSPFDTDIYRYPISELIDNIRAFQKEQSSSSRVMLIVDAQKLQLPTQLGMMHDQFVDTVARQYRKKMESGQADLTLVLSHHPGQNNWPAPELGTSIFGKFVQLAFSGAADGSISGQRDGVVTSREFHRYLTAKVKNYASTHRNAKQDPMILTPQLLATEDATSSTDESSWNDFAITNSEKGETLVVDFDYVTDLDTLVETSEIDGFWTSYFELNDQALTQNPILAARASAILVRIELLLDYGHESEELRQLVDEWLEIWSILQKQSQIVFSPVISIAEARLISENSDNRLLPANKKSFLQNVWANYQDYGPLDLPQTESEASAADEDSGDDQSNGRVTTDAADETETNSNDAQTQEVDDKTEKTDPAAAEDKPDLKKIAEQYQESLRQATEKPWLLPWIVWEGLAANNSGQAISKADLEYWLEKLDSPIDHQLDQSEIVEIKFLQRLYKGIDWEPDNTELLQRCVYLAARCRYLSEDFATGSDQRVLKWFERPFGALEDQRRLAEDLLFANRFQEAEPIFNRVIARLDADAEDDLTGLGRKLEAAFDKRDRVAFDAPYYAALIARLLLRIQQTDSHNVVANDERQFVQKIKTLQGKWVAMIKLNRQLGDALNEPTDDPENGLSRIQQFVEKLSVEDGFLETAEQALLNDTSRIVENQRDDVATTMYISDLLRSPIVDNRHNRKELRSIYLANITRKIFDNKIPTEQLDPVSPDFDPLPPQDFVDLINAQKQVLDELSGNQKALLQLSQSGTWEDSLITTENANGAFDAVVIQINRDLSQSGKVDRLHFNLRKSDHLVRTSATTIAEQMVSRKVENDPRYYLLDNDTSSFEKIRRISLELNQLDRALALESRARRILDDFWGNDIPNDSASPYFFELAQLAIAPGRVSKEYKSVISDAVNDDATKRKTAATRFAITVGSYQFPEEGDAGDRKSHRFEVRSAIADTVGFNGVVAVQQQQQSDLKSGFVVVPFRIGDDQTPPEQRDRRRRLGFKLNETNRTAESNYFFDDQTLNDYRHLDLLLSFRGHLFLHQFEIKMTPRPLKPEEIDVISVRHFPEPSRHADIQVDGDATAKTDVVFVLDCSASMKDQFDLGTPEGANAGVRIDRIEFLKDVLEDTLANMRGARVFRVGFVAIGRRSRYDKAKQPRFIRNEYKRLGFLPETDFERLAEISDITDAALFGQLNKAVKELKPFGMTPLFDGIQLAGKMLLEEKSGNSKVIVVISDGVDETLNPDNVQTRNTADLQSMYPSLKSSLNANNIKLHILGFDMNDPNATKPQRDRFQGNNMAGQFEARLNIIRGFARPNFHSPENGAQLKDRLREINDKQITRFIFSNSDGTADTRPRDLNRIHEIEIDQPDQWNIRLTRNIVGSMPLWLEGGEFTKLRLRGNRLTFVPQSFGKLLTSEPRNQGELKGYDVFRVPGKRSNQIRFAFQNKRSEFSFRPRRLALEIVSADGPERYIIQDFEFVQNRRFWIPVAQFRIPELPSGDYILNLKFLPFAESTAPPVVDNLPLPFEHEIRVDDAKVTINGKRKVQGNKIIVMVKGDNPNLLKEMLVDLETPPSDDRSMLNTYHTTREFAEDGSFVRHEFQLLDEQNPGTLSVFRLSELFDGDRGAGELKFDFTVDK